MNVKDFCRYNFILYLEMFWGKVMCRSVGIVVLYRFEEVEGFLCIVVVKRGEDRKWRGIGYLVVIVFFGFNFFGLKVGYKYC